MTENSKLQLFLAFFSTLKYKIHNNVFYQKKLFVMINGDSLTMKEQSFVTRHQTREIIKIRCNCDVQ